MRGAQCSYTISILAIFGACHFSYRNILARDSVNGLLDLSRGLSRKRLPGDEAAERGFDARRQRSHVASGRRRVASVATPGELAFSGDLAAGHRSRRGALRPIPSGLPGSVQRSGLAPVRSCLPTRPLRSEAWPETNETCPTSQCVTRPISLPGRGPLSWCRRERQARRTVARLLRPICGGRFSASRFLGRLEHMLLAIMSAAAEGSGSTSIAATGSMPRPLLAWGRRIAREFGLSKIVASYCCVVI
jgi:hypothetical protein